VRRAGLAAGLAAALLLGVPGPAALAARAPNGFFGAMWDGPVASSPDPEQERQFGLMSRSGVESLRVAISWAEMEPAPLPPRFEKTDRLVSLAARHGVRLLPVVVGTPDWAKQETFEAGSPPRNPEDYADFLRDLVGRYGPGGSFWSEHPELPYRPIREWQAWNEPHLDGYWSSPGEGWPAGYVKLLAAAYRAIKGEDPGARVVLAALADYSWRHIARIYDQGGRPYFDAATLNVYTWRPVFVLKAIRRFKQAMRSHRDGRTPIYLTEVGWPASLHRNPRPAARWQRAWETTDAGMARRLRRFFSLAISRRAALGLRRVYWYSWASSYERGSIFNFMGLNLFDGDRFETKPALRAFRALAARYGRR
jgi:hypothetical protein